jgi:hypothetical protein
MTSFLAGSVLPDTNCRWIYNADWQVAPCLVSAAGGLLMLICFAFLGPAPYLAPFIQPSFHTVCLALVAQGFGCAAVLGKVSLLQLKCFLNGQ